MSVDNMKMWVVRAKDDPNYPHKGLSPEYPTTCVEINGTNLPPREPHTIMTWGEVKQLKASMLDQYLEWRHHNGHIAKHERQVQVADRKGLLSKRHKKRHSLMVGGYNVMQERRVKRRSTWWWRLWNVIASVFHRGRK